MRYFFTIILILFLASCSGKHKEIQNLNDTDRSVYDQAKIEFNNKHYKKAAGLFSRIAIEFPYSTLSKKSALMEAYSYYLHGDYDNAINAIDNFLYLYPADKNVSYAHYLKAISYYNRINDVHREQETTKKAQAELELLISRFPESEYAREASFKMELVEEHLAGKEMDVARTYLVQNHLISACARFNYVVANFDKTIHVQEALYRLVEIYLTWGDIEEATKAAATLGYNYPESSWYQKAYDLLKTKDLKKLKKS